MSVEPTSIKPFSHDPTRPTPECWRRALRASGFAGVRFSVAFRADLTYLAVDERLQLVGIGPGVARFDALNGAMKNMGADGLLDELRKVTFFGSSEKIVG
jgi:hypothetical protein